MHRSRIARGRGRRLPQDLATATQLVESWRTADARAAGVARHATVVRVRAWGAREWRQANAGLTSSRACGPRSKRGNSTRLERQRCKHDQPDQHHTAKPAEAGRWRELPEVSSSTMRPDFLAMTSAPVKPTPRGCGGKVFRQTVFARIHSPRSPERQLDGPTRVCPRLDRLKA